MIVITSSSPYRSHHASTCAIQPAIHTGCPSLGIYTRRESSQPYAIFLSFLFITIPNFVSSLQPRRRCQLKKITGSKWKNSVCLDQRYSLFLTMSLQPAHNTVVAMPTYRRTLSPNELYGSSPETPVAPLTYSSSYFLPSRAYGLNDMFGQSPHVAHSLSGVANKLAVRVTIHAPLALISPFRVRIAWAVMRLRHSLMACRVEMAPGCYDDAQFVYVRIFPHRMLPPNSLLRTDTRRHRVQVKRLLRPRRACGCSTTSLGRSSSIPS